jgi:hypothetical protein
MRDWTGLPPDGGDEKGPKLTDITNFTDFTHTTNYSVPIFGIPYHRWTQLIDYAIVQ